MEMQKEYKDGEPFYLNYQNIVHSKEMLAITRLLAADMMRNPYCVVGDFIKNMSEGDLQHFITEIDKPEDERNLEDMMLISEMLATGEGCDVSKTAEEFADRLSIFMNFLVCESLARKGLVKVHHHNMSFNDDMSQEIVVEKI
jgi:hypothetical protein